FKHCPKDQRNYEVKITSQTSSDDHRIVAAFLCRNEWCIIEGDEKEKKSQKVTYIDFDDGLAWCTDFCRSFTFFTSGNNALILL
ncbi:hypothetical protein, partial [Faecalicoccus pleomorphus]|uniref:hypothetical protein n=1 Tax=Faecalicoccus pleomorphus TaxID=1323 RepID=UPI001C7005D5